MSIFKCPYPVKSSWDYRAVVIKGLSIFMIIKHEFALMNVIIQRLVCIKNAISGNYFLARLGSYVDNIAGVFWEI